MTNHISAAGSVARESARQIDGKFGTQVKGETNVDLGGVTPAHRPLSAPRMETHDRVYTIASLARDYDAELRWLDLIDTVADEEDFADDLDRARYGEVYGSTEDGYYMTLLDEQHEQIGGEQFVGFPPEGLPSALLVEDRTSWEGRYGLAGVIDFERVRAIDWEERDREFTAQLRLAEEMVTSRDRAPFAPFGLSRRDVDEQMDRVFSNLKVDVPAELRSEWTDQILTDKRTDDAAKAQYKAIDELISSRLLDEISRGSDSRIGLPRTGDGDAS